MVCSLCIWAGKIVFGWSSEMILSLTNTRDNVPIVVENHVLCEKLKSV